MLKVKMIPHESHFRSEESGIKTCVLKYAQHVPRFGIEYVEPDATTFDVIASHAGMTGADCDVAHCHGLYWSADYNADAWEWKANASVIESLRYAKEITVPSSWIAESIMRDMHRVPHVVSHGVDLGDWENNEPCEGFVLGYAKNRVGDVCDPTPMGELAKRFPKVHFMGTFASQDATPNIKTTGVVSHARMKQMVKRSAVFVNATKESGGIAIMEAMAAGIPVLGFRHGGILDTVRHGVEGYLAEPGNYDDLAEGLNYCLKHRMVLSANARIRAREFSWERVAEQVAGIYRLAAKEEPPTVSVIIPCYNYGHTLERAVQSVLRQTYSVEEIIIVDDGSSDNTLDIGRWLAGNYGVRYIRQDNSGVAVARNTGIRATNTKYVMCLDADDQIAPRYIEECVHALESDRSLGVAYSRLQWVKPDGSTGVSQWPGGYDFDKQIKRQNQVHTAALFRRSMWEALGGYRQRYAPNGAGTEDADFWTRAGAYGWGGKLATEEPLFVYSWGSGATSKEGYSETDWLGDKPWAQDGLHPFASQATPRKFSHPVRQYDQPVVSVIIPVGPGHEDLLVDALDSVENQSFRQWEAIVVWDAKSGDRLDEYEKAFPFVRFIRTWEEMEMVDPHAGMTWDMHSAGAGAARNLGVEHARAPFVVFLDADDTLHMQALEAMLDAWSSHEAIAYTDYLGVATVEDPNKLSEAQRRRIISRNEKTNETVILHEAFDYDWRRAQRQPVEDGNPYIWCNVTCLIPKAWHNEIGGFDESMESWEDVDYHWRMARRGKPYVRIPQPLMTYRFYSGTRRETGRQKHRDLVEYLIEKYEGIETMACSQCGRGSRATAPQPRVMMNASRSAPEMNDADWVTVELIDGNVGQHPMGKGVFTGKDYGQRSHGERFLMHREDMKARPGKFREVAEVAPVPTVTEKQEAPDPQPVAGAEAKVAGAEVKVAYNIPDANGDLLTENTKVTPAPGAKERPFDLQTIPGITSTIAQRLKDAGIDSMEDLAAMSFDDLMAVKGIAEARAEQIQAYVQEQMS
jgi:glycosyltransferase involved in cell wall biosynthesis/predicted flap endonuclease-1-like 5' DNA nuclease